MSGTPTGVVDFGFRAAAARRERLLAAASPALRARLLGTTPAYGSVKTTHWISVDLATGARTVERHVDASPGLAEVLRREVRALERTRASLRAEIEALRQEYEMALAEDEDDAAGMGEIAGRFLAELAGTGYRIDGEAVTLAHLASRRRGPAWARPRMVAMWLCCSIDRAVSLPEIAQFFGRDYTTVNHARRAIGRVLAREPALRAAACATCAALGVALPAPLHA